MKKYFDLKVGFTCNNFCLHCVITDKKGTRDYSTKEIKEIIDTLDDSYIVGFTGGEASIRKDWIEILKYAKETGHDTALQTNAVAFYDKQLAEETGKYLDKALVAIHSHIPEIHNKIVNCPASDNMFEKTTEGFKNLIKAGVDVKTQTVISKINIKDLPETYDWIQEISPGIKMSFTYPHPNGNALINSDLVVPMYSEIKEEIQNIISKWKDLLSVEAIPMCYLYPHQNDIDNLDEIITSKKSNPRAGIDPANTCNDFFDERGYTQDYRKADESEKRKAVECKYCVFNERCPGVWKEYAEMYKEKLDLKPIISTNEIGYINILELGSDEFKFENFMRDSQFIINSKFKNVCIYDENSNDFKYILESILYLKENGIQNIDLYTQGNMFKEKEFVEKASLAGLNRISLSKTDKDQIDNCNKYGINIIKSGASNV